MALYEHIPGDSSTLLMSVCTFSFILSWTKVLQALDDAFLSAGFTIGG